MHENHIIVVSALGLLLSACPSPEPEGPPRDMAAPDLTLDMSADLPPDTSGDMPRDTTAPDLPCPDADADDVCDDVDVCAEGDDALDADADGVPDACDVCADGDDDVDVDVDGVPDACDVCSTGDDALDADADGVPDACDLCAQNDDNVDADADGIPDACDPCLADPNGPDTDADGVPDVCDICPGLDDAQVGVRDGMFQDATQWTADGAVGNGMAVLKENDVITKISQRMCTPPVQDVPQKMKVSVSTLCTEPGCARNPSIEFDGILHKYDENPQTDDYTYEVCLGEAYYGITTFEASIQNSPRQTYYALTQVSIEDAPGTCPRIGEVNNGDFSQDLMLWDDLQNVEIVEDAGNKAMRMQGNIASACDRASARTKLSIPESLPNTALRLRWRGTITGNSALQVTLNNQRRLQHRVQDATEASWQQETICLPATTFGAVLDLRLRLGAPGAVDCVGDVTTRDIEVDDFEIVSDPVACP